MKKEVLIGCLVYLLTLAGFAAQEVFVLKVKVQQANVRSEPDANAPVIKQIKAGTLLESTQKLENWYEISITDEEGKTITGYIHASVVDVVSGQKTEEKAVQEEVKKEEIVTPPVAEQVPVPSPAKRTYSPGGFKVLGGMANASVSHSEMDVQGFDMGQYEKSKMGYFGGIGLELGSRFAVEIDLLYIQKGTRLQGNLDFSTGTKGSFDMKTFLDEVSLPVLIKVKILPGSTPYLLAGGEAAYVLSNKQKYSYSVNYHGTQPLEGSGTEDTIQDTNRFDYGIIVGAGFELRLGKIPLLFEGRYHIGMANLAKQNKDYQVEVGAEDWVKTKALLFMLGIRF